MVSSNMCLISSEIYFLTFQKKFLYRNTLNFSVLSEKLFSLKRCVSMDVDFGQAFKFVFFKADS